MKNIKKVIVTAVKFLLMIVILGTQTLLRGSWSPENHEGTTA
jgi:hypothetical protein